jgi:hypothetical protein
MGLRRKHLGRQPRKASPNLFRGSNDPCLTQLHSGSLTRKPLCHNNLRFIACPCLTAR